MNETRTQGEEGGKIIERLKAQFLGGLCCLTPMLGRLARHMEASHH
ncbi:hypothetical protein PFC_02965 [Pyrococcus furiosus COM1]|nr:hypothetical protein PFC_02965 [Pyrococcus furiosus COM1]